MIVNHEYINGKLIVSHINDIGKIDIITLPWHNTQDWVVTSETDPHKNTKFRTWDNLPVKQIDTRYPSRYAIYEFLNNQDISIKDKIFKYNEPNMFFCDIEVEITEGFPEAHIAENKVTAISFIYKDKILLLGIKEMPKEWSNKMTKDINKYFKKFNTNYSIEWHYCKSEYDMLYLLFNNLIPTMPVITGWNFIKYDWVYLVTRARKLGINPNVASPTGKLIKPWSKQNANDNNYKPIYEELPKHRLIVDYMDIFDKWDTSIKIKESVSLDFVAGEILGVKKLEYDGNLKSLYENDYYNYMLYCCIDTALVQLIHYKQRTFDLMLAISNLAKIPMEDSPSAIRVTEGIFFEKFYNINIIMCKKNKSIFDNDEIEIEIEMDIDDLSGGYVKFPSVGLKLWVTVFDFASLYPTIMRQFNIAPESFRGIKINDTEAILNGIRYKIQENDIVLLNGAVFVNEESETKKTITNIFKDRKINKNLGLDYKAKEVLIKKYLENRKINV